MTAMPAARAAAGPSRCTGCPSSSTRPVSGPCTPASTFTSVDLPAPFSPTRAWASPARSSSCAPRRAATAPKDLLTSSRARTAAPGVGVRGVCSTSTPFRETIHAVCGPDHRQSGRSCQRSRHARVLVGASGARRIVDTIQRAADDRGSHTGRDRGGALTASIRDVAGRAGVSVGTVSNVLNRPDTVSEATRAKVLDAIAELGFVRNESARQLRAGSSRTVGLVVLDIANPFFTDVARGVEDVVNAAGLALILCSSDDRPEKEAAHLSLLAEQRVHGVLITPTAELTPQLDALRDRGVPVVLVDRRAPGPHQCAVATDDVLGGRLAAPHLLERGHRRIAFVGGHAALPQVQERHAGVASAVRQVA